MDSLRIELTRASRALNYCSWHSKFSAIATAFGVILVGSAAVQAQTSCPAGAKPLVLSLSDSGNAVYGPVCVGVPINALRYSGTIKLQTTVLPGSDLSAPFKAGGGKGYGVNDLPSLIRELGSVEAQSNQAQADNELASSTVTRAVTALNTVVGSSDVVFQKAGSGAVLSAVQGKVPAVNPAAPTPGELFAELLSNASAKKFETTELLYKEVLDLQYFTQAFVFNPPAITAPADPIPAPKTDAEKAAAAQAKKDQLATATQAQKDQISAAVSALKDLLTALAPYLPTADKTVNFYKQKQVVATWKAYIESLGPNDFLQTRYVACKVLGNQSKNINVVAGRLDLLPTIAYSPPVAADIAVPLLTVTCSSPFSISGGLEVSFVKGTSYGLLPTPTSGSYTFGVTKTTSASPMPIGMVHARLFETQSHKLAFQVGVGVSAHTQDASAGGTSAEYLFGGGVALWHTVYLTPGLHVARTASLSPGYHIGDPVASGVTSARLWEAIVQASAWRSRSPSPENAMGVLPNLTIPSQGLHRNLCWAAVTVGVCGYLDHSRLTLQEVASDCLPFCNGDLTSHFCDVPWQLQDALGQYRHAAQPNGRALTMAEIIDQIANRQRPIGMMISYPDNVNHYCLVKGFVEVNGITEVVILDPAQSDPRDTPFPLESLLTGAALGAPWSDSCLVT